MTTEQNKCWIKIPEVWTDVIGEPWSIIKLDKSIVEKDFVGTLAYSIHRMPAKNNAEGQQLLGIFLNVMDHASVENRPVASYIEMDLEDFKLMIERFEGFLHMGVWNSVDAAFLIRYLENNTEKIKPVVINSNQ